MISVILAEQTGWRSKTPIKLSKKLNRIAKNKELSFSARNQNWFRLRLGKSLDLHQRQQGGAVVSIRLLRRSTF